MSGSDVVTRDGVGRRAVVRGLAAALLAAGGGIAATTQAKQKRRKKGQQQPKPPQAICPPGKQIATLAVPADGSEVFTPVLAKGQRYSLRASGYWSTNGEYMNDAVAAFPFANPGEPVFFHNGVRLGLSVNGQLPDIWGTYKLSHAYRLVVVGDGKRLPLRMLDSVYSDNARLLTVEVFCATATEE